MENLARFETDLWEAADNLLANSKLASSDYFMPVLGVIFLRRALWLPETARYDYINQLATHFFREGLIGAGAIFASVTKAGLLSQKLLSPATKLIRAFEGISQPIDDQIRVLFLQNKKLRLARDLLLPQLMGGEISV
jgi:hypothetical protein